MLNVISEKTKSLVFDLAKNIKDIIQDAIFKKSPKNINGRYSVIDKKLSVYNILTIKNLKLYIIIKKTKRKGIINLYPFKISFFNNSLSFNSEYFGKK
jgi:hypothetical protein